MVHRSVDQVDRTDQVIVVVEPLDEMAQSLGCIGSQVIHVAKRIAIEQAVDQFVVQHRSLNELRPSRHVLLNPPLRSSSTTASCPVFSRCSATCDPMNPAPPVTNDVGMLYSPSIRIPAISLARPRESGSLRRSHLLHLRLTPLLDKIHRIDHLVPADRARDTSPAALLSFRSAGTNSLRRIRTAVCAAISAPRTATFSAPPEMLVKIAVPVPVCLERKPYRKSSHRLSSQVRDGHRWRKSDRESRLPDPPAQIDFFEMVEEPLIEPAELSQ